MQNRYYYENIRLINDIIDYCHITRKPSVILLVEKAFDTICWDFLKCCLATALVQISRSGLPPSTEILKVVLQIMDTNQSTSIYRGIRQGCPLSALLFLLATKVVAIILRN